MPTILAIVLDLACVALLAVIGRSAHSEGLGAAEVGRTAMPFVVACLAAWVFLMLRRFTDSPWVQGLTVWVVTVGVGMVVRGLLGEGTHWSFVLVAATFLAATMAGWRGIAGLVLRRRATRESVTARSQP